MYVDSSEACNSLVFQLGSTAVGTAIPGNRRWNIKVIYRAHIGFPPRIWLFYFHFHKQITQYSCDFPNLAPKGCTQYFFGGDTGTVQVKTHFNFSWM